MPFSYASFWGMGERLVSFPDHATDLRAAVSSCDLRPDLIACV